MACWLRARRNCKNISSVKKQIELFVMEVRHFAHHGRATRKGDLLFVCNLSLLRRFGGSFEFHIHFTRVRSRRLV